MLSLSYLMKNVLITGVSGGMGKATALQFSQNGYNVYGLDINDIEEIDHLYFYKLDLTKEYEVKLNYCPNCRSKLKINQEECPSCGINIKEYLYSN